MRKITKVRLAFSNEEMVQVVKEMGWQNLQLERLSHSTNPDNRQQITYKMTFGNETYGLET